MAAPGFGPTYRRWLAFRVWRRRTAARSFLLYCSAPQASRLLPLAAVDGCEARAAANAWSWLPSLGQPLAATSVPALSSLLSALVIDAVRACVQPYHVRFSAVRVKPVLSHFCDFGPAAHTALLP